MWPLPRELLWAIIGSLLIFLSCLWPLHYPYSQSANFNPQEQSENGVSGNQAAQGFAPGPSDTTLKQQTEYRRENASEVTFLGIKPGEWLLATVTWMLWWATVRLVSESKITAERQLRAYVFVEHHLYSKGSLWTGTVTIKNSGQTPAHHLRANVTTRVLSSPVKEADFALIHDGNESEAALSKDAAFISNWTEEVSKEQIDAINAGTMIFYILVTATYTDVFGHEQTCRSRVFSRPGDGMSLSYSNEGNDQT
jgi:hypothetical protein